MITMRECVRVVAVVVFGCGAFSWLGAVGSGAGPSSDEQEVLTLDQRIADATVRGDTAYVDRVTPADFVMVHGDGWKYGGKPLLTDTKASLLRRVTSKYYDVLDFDSVKAEVHGNVAITYGRYLAHTSGGDDPTRRWFAVWFERVYAKRNGTWMYLSHRTVHGPTFGSDRVSAAAASPQPPMPIAQSAVTITPADQRAAGQEVLAVERETGAAIVRGDAAFYNRVTAPDFVMTHGDAWTRGGAPTLVDDKASFGKRVAAKAYAVHDYDVQAAEMHGDVAITYGRYIGHIPSSPEGRRWFYVWYEKVYAKRDGHWTYLSHRSINGAHYGPDRRSVSLE